MTAAATAPATTAPATATATAATFGERHICRAKSNPERADACGKSQDNKPGDDKPADKLIADPAHDVIPSPKRRFLRRSGNAVLMRTFRHLRDCDAALHRRRGRSLDPPATSPRGMAEIGSNA
jgi:hypothetical protein